MRAQALTFVRRGRTILDAVDVDCAPGTVTVLLGPNGAGKSTLLACLAGLETPDAGTVTLDGSPVAAMPARERARRIGLLAQNADIHWDMPARTLVGLGRMPYQGRWGQNPADAAAVDAAMRATDCQHLADRPARQLSGGEQARVLLARVLAGQPEWLLADEPLANLDIAHQLDTLAVLRRAADGGAGVIIVLHDLTLAARIADRLIVLADGRIVANGAPRDVLTPALLAAVFGIRADVTSNARGLTIMPLARV